MDSKKEKMKGTNKC